MNFGNRKQQTKHVHNVFGEKLYKVKFAVASYDAEGQDTCEGLIYCIEKGLKEEYDTPNETLLDEKGAELMKKTVPLIAVWHLKKHLLESFAHDPDVFSGLIVELCTYFGVNKYKTLADRCRSTRKTELGKLIKADLNKLLVALRGRVTAPSTDLGKRPTNPAMMDEILRLEDEEKKQADEDLQKLSEKVEEAVKKKKEEVREGNVNADALDGYDNVDDDDDAAVRATGLKLNELTAIVDVQALVRTLRKFEKDLGEDRTELDNTYLKFSKHISNEDLSNHTKETIAEVEENYQKLQQIIKTQGEGKIGLAFCLSEKANKGYKMSFDRLDTILTAAYNGAVLGEEEIRIKCVRTYLNLELDMDDVAAATSDEDEDKHNTHFMKLVNDDVQFQRVIDSLAKLRPAVAFFYRCAYCDLRLAIEPFRDLYGGKMQTLVDNLPRMAFTLADAGKRTILRDVIMTIGRFRHFEENQPLLLKYLAANCKKLFTDWHGECVNSRYRRMLANDLINITKEAAEEASLLSIFPSLIRDIYKDCVGAELGDDEGAVREHEIDRVNARDRADPMKATNLKMRDFWILQFDLALSGDERVKNFRGRDRIKTGATILKDEKEVEKCAKWVESTTFLTEKGDNRVVRAKKILKKNAEKATKERKQKEAKAAKIHQHNKKRIVEVGLPGNGVTQNLELSRYTRR